MLSFLKNALLAVCATALFLASLEGLARWFFPEPAQQKAQELKAPGEPAWGKILEVSNFRTQGLAEPDPLLGYRLRQNLTQNEYHFNSLGFRGPEFSRQKPDNVFRIVCLGGSTTIGSNAGDNNLTYPALLQALLRATSQGSQKIEVINAGVFGYNSHHTRLRLPEILGLQPDLILVMDGLNDLMAARLMSMSELAAMTGQGQISNPLLAGSRDGLAAWLNARLMGLRAYAVMRQALDRLLNAQRNRDLLKRMELYGYRANMAAIIQTCQAQGLPLVLINHPWIVAQGPGLDHQFQDLPQPLDPELFAAYAFGRDYLTRVNAQIAQETATPLVNPQPDFDQARDRGFAVIELFSDTIHYTAFGNYLLARSAYLKLLELEPVRQALGTSQPLPDERLDQLAPPLTEACDPSQACPPDMLLCPGACPARGRAALTGLSRQERDGKFRWRWGLGPATTISFHLDRAQAMILNFTFTNPYPGQNITITANGQELAQYPNLAQSLEPVTGQAGFSGLAGDNQVIFSYRLWSQGQNQDQRPLAARFFALGLKPAQASGP